jgi:hypothetical protein
MLASRFSPLAGLKRSERRSENADGGVDSQESLPEAEEAESAFRDAMPLIRRAYGSAAFVLHDAAWLLARRGRIADAARLSAYAESVYAAMGRKPRPVALHNQERLRALLSTQHSAEALVALNNEGRALTDDQACLLAFPPLATGA